MEIILTVIITLGITFFVFLRIFERKSKEQNEQLKELSKSLTESIEKANPMDYLIKQQEIATSTKETTTTIKEDFSIVLREIQKMNLNTENRNTLNQEVFKKVNELSNIMVNHKSRGNFGEFQLSNIMSIYCGESKDIYGMQFTLKNGFIADCVLKSPDSKKFLCIDSKFPLDNYNHIIDDSNSEDKIKSYQNLFKADVKKHINDIAKKYITSETEPYAVMFVPSEAIFQYIAAENSELIEYGHRKKVLMVSPTTLIGVVFTIMSLTKDLKRAKNTKKIEKLIVDMLPDIERLETRHSKLTATMQTLLKYTDEESKSIEKIGNKVRKVHAGFVDETEEESEKEMIKN